jgi:hypothetical protein
MRSDARPFVIGLLVVQVGLTAALWLLDAISVSSTAAFALLLAADVLVFAVLCHTYFFSEEDRAETAVEETEVPSPPPSNP